MRNVLALSICLLTLVSCGTSPEKARKNLVALGLEYDDYSFYAAANNCDSIPIDDFLSAGLPPDAGLVGAAAGGCTDIFKKLKKQTKNPQAFVEALSAVLDNSPTPEYNEIFKSLIKTKELKSANLDGFLAKAAGDGNLERVKAMISSGIDPNDSTGNSSALFASIGKNPEIVKLLLDKGANPNSVRDCNSDGTCISALSTAVRSGNKPLVKLLIAEGAKVNDGVGDTSLALAQAIRNTEKHGSDLVSLLIDEGANVTQVPEGTNPHLMTALSSSEPDWETTKLLLENGADPSDSNIKLGYRASSPLSMALEDNQLEIATLMLKAGADPNKREEREVPTLTRFVSANNIEGVKFLLENGADPNVPDDTTYRRNPEDQCYVLHIANYKGYADIAALLVEKGGTPGNKPTCVQELR